MKTLFFNGKIYQNKDQFVSALLVEDGKIIRTGSGELNDLCVDEKIDLKGNTVVPGFNDSHLHITYYSRNLLRVNLEGVKNKEEVVERCKQFLLDNPDTEGIYGRGYNEDLFDVPGMFTRADLDLVSKDIPITCTRICGHKCVCNSKALELLGFESELGDLYEADCDKTKRLYPMDNETVVQALVKGMKIAESVGITSVQSQDIDDYPVDLSLLRAIEKLYENEDDLLRYHMQCNFLNPKQFKEVVESGNYKYNTNNPKLTMGPLKLFKDGSLGAKTALLYDGYNDEPDNHGIDVKSAELLDEYVSICEANGIQAFIHAIGDKAIEEVVDCYIRNMKPGNPNRHAVNHCQITNERIMDKISKNNILVAYQPIFLEYDLHMVKNRVSKQLESTSYCYKTALDKGVHISFGTDCPVESFNPFYNIHCAVNRQDLNHQPELGYNSFECLSVEQAIDAYTIGSSYNQFMENEKGRLIEGHYCDLVVLDKDIFTCDKKDIMTISPLMTVINGKVVYKK